MRIKLKVGAGVTVLVSLLFAAVGAAPALAGSGPTAKLSPVTARLANLMGDTSTIYGGWVFKPNPAAASVTADFAVPTLTCTNTTAGVAPAAVMITGGNTFNAAGLLLECMGGAPAAAAQVTVDAVTVISPHALKVGDEIRVTITTNAAKTIATLTDLTTGDEFKLTKAGPGAASTEELVIDDSLISTATGMQLPVVNFGDIEFTAGKVGGMPLGKVTPSMGIDMETSQGVLQILTGRLRGSRKDEFFTTWKHS